MSAKTLFPSEVPCTGTEAQGLGISFGGHIWTIQVRLERYLLFLRFFFVMWTILKVFIEFVTILLLFMFWFSSPEACGAKSASPELESKALTIGQPRKPQLSENGTDKMICGEILNQHQELLTFSLKEGNVEFNFCVHSSSFSFQRKCLLWNLFIFNICFINILDCGSPEGFFSGANFMFLNYFSSAS